MIISKEEIERLASSPCETVKMGEKTTVVCMRLPNGFEIVESSSCIDKNNYDEKLGKSICIDRIRNRLWELEGYKRHD